MRSTRAGYVSWMAGCFTCHGSDAAWTARNAQGLAAQHHDKTGHPTWFEGVMSVRYGLERPLVKAEESGHG